MLHVNIKSSFTSLWDGAEVVCWTEWSCECVAVMLCDSLNRTRWQGGRKTTDSLKPVQHIEQIEVKCGWQTEPVMIVWLETWQRLKRCKWWSMNMLLCTARYVYVWLNVFLKICVCVRACVYLQGSTNVCVCMSHWLIALALQPSVWCPGIPSNKHTVILRPWISASRYIFCSPPRARKTQLGRCSFQQQPCYCTSTVILPGHGSTPPIPKDLGYDSRIKH